MTAPKPPSAPKPASENPPRIAPDATQDHVQNGASSDASMPAHPPATPYPGNSTDTPGSMADTMHDNVTDAAADTGKDAGMVPAATSSPRPPRERLGRLPRFVQWLVMIAGALGASAVLHHADIPAALLLGPMLVGIVMGTNGATITVPRPLYLGAQSVLGCMIGGAMTGAIVTSFAADWPIVLGVTALTLAASSALGWILCVRQVLPGTVGIWGSSPGAASAMVIMAEAFGADARLVAFMQYVRVVVVVAVASSVANFWVDPAASATQTQWFAPFDIPGFAITLVLAALLSVIGVISRLPSGALLVPIIASAILHVSGLVEIVLPEWFLGLTYAVIGTLIGLKFTPSVLRYAANALPKILIAVFVLIAFCAGVSALLVVFMGVDPLTAYLATSPGGLDSVAIIAASTNVDLSFILVLQSTRFFMVLLLGPALARMVAKRTPRHFHDDATRPHL